MKQELKDQQLYFHAPSKNHQIAIMFRLEQLGLTLANKAWDNRTNITVGYYNPGYVHSGAAHQEFSGFEGFRVTTLEELYDLDSWLPEVVTKVTVGCWYVLNDGITVRVVETNRDGTLYRYEGHPHQDVDDDCGWVTTSGRYLYHRQDYRYSINHECAPPTKTIIFDGKEVEISQESFEALREQFCED